MGRIATLRDQRFVRGDFEPAYTATWKSGQLDEKVAAARAELANCLACPRDCGVNRLLDEKAVCHTGRWPYVASAFAHFGEEDCLRGWNGSGTIFFSYCNVSAMPGMSIADMVYGERSVVNTRAGESGLPRSGDLPEQGSSNAWMTFR